MPLEVAVVLIIVIAVGIVLVLGLKAILQPLVNRWFPLKAAVAIQVPVFDPQPTNSAPYKAGPLVKFVAGLVVFAIIWFVIDTFLVPAQMSQIENDVAADQVKQYNMVKQSGTRMGLCVQAGAVSAAYLQAKDTPNYDKWESTRRADCVHVGLPAE
jgi:hypothetical protein